MIAASQGVFAAFQPHYAAHRVATFPVLLEPDRKRPMVKHYERIGLSASEQLARKFSDASALGFMAGERSGITVLDCDSSDERVLADAMAKHGRSPLVIRSVSGHFQAYFRHGGERRQIRPFRGLPIDILGNGVVVAPPSRRDGQGYAIVEGSLDDIENLPPLQKAPAGAGQPHSKAVTARGRPWGEMRRGDGRNRTLWESLMREARTVDDWDQFLDRAETLNEQFGEPMDSGEVTGIAGKVWEKTVQGENWFGRRGVYFEAECAIRLVTRDPERFLVESFLRAHNGPAAEFMATNEWLATSLGRPRKVVAAARARMLADGTLIEKRSARPGTPAIYRWARVVKSDHQSSKNPPPCSSRHLLASAMAPDGIEKGGLAANDLTARAQLSGASYAG